MDLASALLGAIWIVWPLSAMAGERAVDEATKEPLTQTQRDVDSAAQGVDPSTTASRKSTSDAGIFARERWKLGGLYAGAHVAYLLGSSHVQLSSLSESTPRYTFGSPYGGLEVGYLLPLHSRFVVGAEADVSFPNFLAGDDVVATLNADGRSYDEHVDFIATLRSRVGYGWNQWLGYITGGVAGSRARLSETTNSSSSSDQRVRFLTGFSLGFGAEVGISQEWTARLEFLHDEFLWDNATFASGATLGSRTQLNTVRLALGWLP